MAIYFGFLQVSSSSIRFPISKFSSEYASNAFFVPSQKIEQTCLLLCFMLTLELLKKSFSFHHNLHHIHHPWIFHLYNPNPHYYPHLHPAPFHTDLTAIVFDQFQEVLFEICSLVFFGNENHVELFVLPSISCFNYNFWYQSLFNGFDWFGCRYWYVRRSTKHNFQNFLWSSCIYFWQLAIQKTLILNNSFEYFKQFPPIITHQLSILQHHVPN